MSNMGLTSVYGNNHLGFHRNIINIFFVQGTLMLTWFSKITEV